MAKHWSDSMYRSQLMDQIEQGKTWNRSSAQRYSRDRSLLMEIAGRRNKTMEVDRLTVPMERCIKSGYVICTERLDLKTKQRVCYVLTLRRRVDEQPRALQLD